MNGESDLPNVVKLQDRYELMPLSKLTGTPPPASKALPPEFMPYEAQKGRTLGFFSYLNLLIQYQNLQPAEQALLKKFSVIGIAPGKPFDPAALDEPMRTAMEEGLQAGLAKIRRAQAVPSHLVNGWFTAANKCKIFRRQLSFPGGRFCQRALRKR